MPPTDAPTALVQDAEPGGGGRWWRFTDPVGVLRSERLEEVMETLTEVERAVADGFHAVGFLSYESAPAFDPALEAAPRGPLPFAWSQLTSTVTARTRASVPEILRALFPSASITGAPKIRTSRIIRQLEVAPRGVYAGTVGHLAPGGRACFNVAIRTATVDRERDCVSYGTGGGIVWDSEAASEYEECRTKTFVLKAAAPRHELLETLLWRPRRGYFLLERHLERMAASAEYFDFPWRGDEARQHLEDSAAGFGGVRTRVRLRLDRDGRLRLDATPEDGSGERTVWTLGLDDRPVDSSEIFLFHKTTRRRVYQEALSRHPNWDEVLLWNERGELTEATRANLVLKSGGEYLTPPVDCGLLPGTYRAELLARGRLREEVLNVETLEAADEVLLINSVRGWIRTRLRHESGKSSQDPVEC